MEKMTLGLLWELEVEVEVKEEVLKANVLVKRSEKREWNEKEKIK